MRDSPTNRSLPEPETRAGAAWLVAAGLGLAVATLLAHGWSLADGSVLDDHWHQRGLREYGWSWSDLMRTLIIEPSQWVHLWWQDKVVRWEYGRPFFILVMKVVYHTLGGDNPAALHALSLALHWASACMVCGLTCLLTGKRGWSFAAGLIFVLYMHAGVTVAWSSSQNCVIQTALMLAALLLYLRATQLDVSGRAPANPSDEIPAIRGVALLGVIALWTLALFTKENALMLPAILLALEWSFAGWPRVWRRRWVYAAFAAIGLVFILWRLWAVQTPMPDVYVRRDGDFVEHSLWRVAKLLHYLCTSIWLAPMMIGPSGRLNPFTETPGDVALTAGIVTVIGLGAWWTLRGVRGAWIWPLWILLSVLPVVDVMATPHSGYQCGVGFAVAVGLAAARARAGWPRRVGVTVCCFNLLAMSVFTMLNRWQWTAIIAAERYGNAWVREAPPEAGVTDVFFMNLPFVNIYAKPALDRQLGATFAKARAHVLTFAPDPILIEQPVWLTQVDDHRLRLRVDGQRYFSRLLGRFLIDGFRHEGAFRAGDVIAGEVFDTAIIDADAEGVHELEFAFRRPLYDPSYCFYFGSSAAPAARIRFRPVAERDPAQDVATSSAPAPAPVEALGKRFASGDAQAGEWLIAIAASPSPDAPLAEQAALAVLRPLATLLGAPTQTALSAPSRTREDWLEIQRWRRTWVDDRALRELYLPLPRMAHFIKEREEAPHARMWAAKVIHSDLYLTGPPYPGPTPRP